MSSRRRLVFASLLFLAGSGAVALGLSQSFGSLLFGIGSVDSHAVPGEFDEELEPGIFTLFLRTTTSAQAGVVTFSRTDGFDIERLAVFDPSGRRLLLESSVNTTLERSGEGYRSVVEFSAAEGGVYHFEVVTSAPTRALVFESIAAIFREDWPWAMLAVVGGLMAAFGVVLFFVALARRSSGRVQPVLDGPPPPPDPFS